jgi:hypothetical protein
LELALARELLMYSQSRQRGATTMRHQLSVALLLAATACVNNAPSDDTAEVSSNLELENGGFDTSDEAPMFGQEEAFAAAAIEADDGVTDPMASDPTITSLDSAPSVARHRLLIVWGQLPPDLNATDTRDWGGTLTLSRGGMIVRRTVGFESATDRLAPRTSRDVVAFDSVTRPFVDGLALTVLDPDPAAADALSLTYHEVSTNQDFAIDLSQLAAGPISIDAGNGYRIFVVGLRDRDACDHGFMRGRWVMLRENLGVYRGVVANADGESIGHIRGIFGHRKDGTPAMFGKLIGAEGNFLGIVAGTYEDGHFHARWLTRAGDHGALGGMYIDAPNLRGGFFAGRWAETSCAEQ